MNYACTYLGEWEQELCGKSDRLPTHYWRYVDDVWGLWELGLEKFQEFHKLANSLHPRIKTELRFSSQQIEFLDVNIKLKDGFIHTDLFSSGKESEDLPYLYWIPKLHKTPYKERYIAGLSTCSTKELSIHLTKILSAVKEGQQKYCETVYSRSGINHMWILKNSKELLDNLKSRSFSQVSSSKLLIFQLYIPPYRMTN